jgi:hypothetical protein
MNSEEAYPTWSIRTGVTQDEYEHGLGREFSKSETEVWSKCPAADDGPHAHGSLATDV